MKNDEHIQRTVEQTLSVLDTVRHAQTDPYFYTRLKARMQSSSRDEINTGTIAHGRILLAAFGVVLLLALNLFSLLHYSLRTTQVQKEQTMASFTEEYHLSYSRY